MPPSRTTETSSSSNLQNSTSITSPLRRIPSFIEDEDNAEEFAAVTGSNELLISKSPIRSTGNNSTKSSPGTSAMNKKKRNHSEEVHENEHGQLNRLTSEEQSQSIKDIIALMF